MEELQHPGPPWHGGGNRFDPGRVHYKNPAGQKAFGLTRSAIERVPRGTHREENENGIRGREGRPKLKLAAAWMSLIALYIYADFLSLYRPGLIDDIRRGLIGPTEVSQATLVLASLIVIIPAVMIVLALLLPARVNRPLNLVLAILYTLVNISNLVGEGWVYYVLFGIAEIAITAYIFFTAWRWPPKAVTE